METVFAFFASVLIVTSGCDTHRQPAPASTSPADEAAGIRFIEIVTGGATASEPLPLIVGIHGFGGSPDKFARAFAHMSTRARVILPYGFTPAGEGFAWWSSEWVDEARFADDTRSAADRLAPMLDELARRRPTVGKPIVTGFSQGGMLSFTLAVLHPESLRAAFPVGGRLAEPLWPTAWPAGKPTPIVHAFHGDADDVVPVAGARATVHRLAEVGLIADLKEYPGLSHHISREEQDDLVRAIERAIVPPN
jgi:phospholipase/carboxylesterase